MDKKVCYLKDDKTGKFMGSKAGCTNKVKGSKINEKNKGKTVDSLKTSTVIKNRNGTEKNMRKSDGKPKTYTENRNDNSSWNYHEFMDRINKAKERNKLRPGELLEKQKKLPRDNETLRIPYRDEIGIAGKG